MKLLLQMLAAYVNPANLRLVEQILSFRTDIALISAPEAHLGIQLALAHLPNVILMDIHLPGMSGAEAQRVLRDEPRTAHIPVIALSASAMPRETSKKRSPKGFSAISPNRSTSRN